MRIQMMLMPGAGRGGGSCWWGRRWRRGGGGEDKDEDEGEDDAHEAHDHALECFWNGRNRHRTFTNRVNWIFALSWFFAFHGHFYTWCFAWHLSSHIEVGLVVFAPEMKDKIISLFSRPHCNQFELDSCFFAKLEASQFQVKSRPKVLWT